MRVVGIHHVFIPSGSLDDTRQFYCELLGMPIDPRGPRTAIPGPGLWLGVGADQQLHTKENATEWHVCLDVDDLDSSVAELRAAGIEVAPITVSPEAGSRQTLIRDPAGHLVELRAALPA